MSTQFERIEKFLSGGLELLTSPVFEKDLQSDELILDDNFAINFTTDLDVEGRFLWVQILGKFDDDYFYDSVLEGMSIDSLTGLDDMCNYILKRIEKIRQLETMESEAN